MQFVILSDSKMIEFYSSATLFVAVTSILVIFVNTFNKSHEDNIRNAEAEKKKLEMAAMKEKANSSAR